LQFQVGIFSIDQNGHNECVRPIHSHAIQVAESMTATPIIGRPDYPQTSHSNQQIMNSFPNCFRREFHTEYRTENAANSCVYFHLYSS
jgi:hypothetical protein